MTRSGFLALAAKRNLEDAHNGHLDAQHVDVFPGWCLGGNPAERGTMDNSKFFQRYADAADSRVELRCVGGAQDGRRFSVPRGQRRFSMGGDYRVATIATYEGDYSFLTPADWSDAQALSHLFGGAA